MNRPTTASIAIIVAFAATASPAGGLGPPSRPATAAMPPAVEPFDLADVRLLDSPFAAVMERNARYLLQLEPDRFLHYFRTEAGLAARAEPYGGWEAADQGAGRCLGHYLSALSLQYRSSGDRRFRERIEYIVNELAMCQSANGNGLLCAQKDGRQFWARLAAGDADALKAHRVPWYIQHKMFAGLRDAWQLVGVEKARAVLIALSDWAINETRGLSDQQFQNMLDQEHGGMCEVLTDVYAITGDNKYLVLAGRFEHRKVIDPLERRQDRLAGLHANTQIPKLIGEARLYELTADPRHRRAAESFWTFVVHDHSYANGGNSDGERFDPPGALASHLNVNTSETCNTYNMLKLSWHLMQWEPRVEYADYCERALYNHILASCGPEPGNYTYYVAMKPGHYRLFSSPSDSFWCCVGTGMENHARYAESIYFRHGDDLYVNLFIPSELHWTERGMKLRLETQYPADSRVRLTISCDKPTNAAFHLRYPAWAAPGMTVTVNGQQVTTDARPGTYAIVKRTWNNGDVVEWTVPLALRTEALSDDHREVAVLWGPLLLGGRLAPLTTERQLLGDSPSSRGGDLAVPALAVGDRPVEQWVKPVSGSGLQFRIDAPGLAEDVMLVPFYQLNRNRYAVYWHLTDAPPLRSGS